MISQPAKGPLVKEFNINTTKGFLIQALLTVSETQIAAIKIDTKRFSETAIEIYNLSSKSVEIEQVLRVPRVKCPRFMKGRRIIAGVSKKIYLWHLGRPENQPDIMEGHTARVTVVTELKNDLVASGSDDGAVIIWDLKQPGGRCIAKLEDHRKPIRHISQLSNEQIISASGDGEVRVWDFRESSTRACIASIKQNKDTCLGCSPDGKVVFLDWLRQTLVIWDLYSQP